MKRILSLLLCLALCLSLLPASFAEDIEIVGEPLDDVPILAPEEEPPAEDDPVTYRALLVGEVSFTDEYGGTANRSIGNTNRIGEMLQNVYGPEGGRYEITVAHDLGHDDFREVIASTFAEADDNDVSLFFVSSHGVINIASGRNAGRIITIEEPYVRTGFLPMEDLAAWLKQVPGQVIVAIDSCGSGAAIYDGGESAFLPDGAGAEDAGFTDAVISAFAEADGCVPGACEPQTGEFRSGKFYVLTASAHQERAWGQESSDIEYCYSKFPFFFAQACYYKKNSNFSLPKFSRGSMPADYDGNLTVTLDEMYRFVFYHALGDETTEVCQHAQVYPENCEYPLFTTKLSMSKSEQTLAVNKSAKLNAQISSGAPAANVVWSSSDETVAEVSQTGVVAAKKYGTATITARVKNTDFAVTCQVQTLFWDVADPSQYYFKHVYWAAENGITKGYDLEYFAPQEECTREQMMMFLWRLAGQPKPGSAASPFPDVQNGDYFCKAVLWGVENKITAGFSEGEHAGRFGVGLPCTREQAMTFLWRLAGRPDPDATANPFSDIQDTDYFYKAVLWANENGVANGYEDGSYGVGLACLREHMVTFLSKYDAKFGNH